jgi:hypothetical protein
LSGVTLSAAPAPSAGTNPASRTHEAIARAAERTGADFSYLLAQARLESSLDPGARARTSSAAGLYQFIDSTWLETLDRHGTSFGMDGVAQAIEGDGGRARVGDPALRAPIMALRFDPEASALMAGALAQDNRAALASVLGRDPDAAELYLAHFLGAAGATKFLTALAADPSAPAAGLLPGAAAANRTIFYSGGSPRSLAGVMDLMRDKMARAMDGTGGGAPPATGHARFAVAQAGWQAVSGSSPAGVAGMPDSTTGGRPSMSDTLRTSFALADAPTRHGGGHVHSAYGKLKALGL